MKIIIDMNLSPDWVPILEKQGWETKHWSTAGNPRAEDSEIMEWARHDDYVVFTHDLDFSALLAASREDRPSVFQVRGQDVMPNKMESVVIAAMYQFELLLEQGALVSVDENKARARILPLVR